MDNETHEIVRVVVPVDGDWHAVPLPGPIVGVSARQYSEMELWVRDEGATPSTPRRLRAVGTGQQFPATAVSISSVVADRGLVFHLIEDSPADVEAAR